MNPRRVRPFLGHGLILASLVASLGVTHALHLAPREREARALRADEAALRTRLADVVAGLEEMKAWETAHPGRDPLALHARRALPEREMVPAFLEALASLAERHGIATRRIRPAGDVSDVTVTDAAGRSTTYRRTELRLSVHGGYRALGGYLRDIEAIDQVVLVRSVALRRQSATGPELAADIAVWIHGTR
jgi:Tfp pilus assembly protein PilO